MGSVSNFRWRGYEKIPTTVQQGQGKASDCSFRETLLHCAKGDGKSHPKITLTFLDCTVHVSWSWLISSPSLYWKIMYHSVR
jgi:hypothetical protein